MDLFFKREDADCCGALPEVVAAVGAPRVFEVAAVAAVVVVDGAFEVAVVEEFLNRLKVLAGAVLLAAGAVVVFVVDWADVAGVFACGVPPKVNPVDGAEVAAVVAGVLAGVDFAPGEKRENPLAGALVAAGVFDCVVTAVDVLSAGFAPNMPEGVVWLELDGCPPKGVEVIEPRLPKRGFAVLFVLLDESEDTCAVEGKENPEALAVVGVDDKFVVAALPKVKMLPPPGADWFPVELFPNNDGWLEPAAGVPAGVVDPPNKVFDAAGVVDPNRVGFDAVSSLFFSAGFPNVNPVDAGFEAPPNNPLLVVGAPPNSEDVGALVVAVDWVLGASDFAPNILPLVDPALGNLKDESAMAGECSREDDARTLLQVGQSRMAVWTDQEVNGLSGYARVAISRNFLRVKELWRCE
jgi:hypothetical protein